MLVVAAAPEPAAPSTAFHLPLRADLGEARLPDEDALIDDTIEVLRTIVARKLPGALRDVHAKSHGCVAARFVVDDDVPAGLRAGLFATPGSHQATVRFSSSELSPSQRDWDSSFRGIAIKVHDVEGEPYLRDSSSGAPRVVQDFLLNNRPAFALRDLREYHDAMVVRRDPLVGGWFLLTHPHAVQPLLVDSKRIADPLAATYWSMAPQAIGDVAAKLMVRPCVARRARLTDAGPDYLRTRLQERLAKGDACLEVLAQARDPASPRAARLPIEDATVVWSERDAPPVRVARLLIPAQAFDTPEGNARCEALTFNPWHALAAHRPLGSLNRGRLSVYRALAAFRHAHGAPSAPRDP